MATNNAGNQKFTNNADGFDIAGGTTARKVTVSGADIAMVGSGTAVITFPTSTSTLSTLALAETLSNKTLTAPKFADLGFIADANGNELIILDTVASAVNEITLANAATGNNPKFTTSGGDANIGFDFQAKGTGTYKLLGTADQAAELRLYEDTTDGTNYTAFKVGTQSADLTYTLPTAYPAASGYALTSTTAGVMSWAAAGGGAWTLVSYSTASAATSITVSSLDLGTDLRYKVIVEADAAAATASTFLVEMNGVTTADSYWCAGVGRGYDGTTATNEPFGSKSTSLPIQNNDTNSIQGEFDFSLVTGDATNARILVEFKVVGLYSGATQIIYHSSGTGYQNTETNLTSLKFKVGAGNKNWRVWILKPATS